jgi:hypothetical protein
MLVCFNLAIFKAIYCIFCGAGLPNYFIKIAQKRKLPIENQVYLRIVVHIDKYVKVVLWRIFRPEKVVTTKILKKCFKLAIFFVCGYYDCGVVDRKYNGLVRGNPPPNIDCCYILW